MKSGFTPLEISNRPNSKVKFLTGLTIFELITTACIIFALVGMFAIYANMTLRVGRETALQSELANIRMALEHFLIINNSCPQSLSELINQRLTEKKVDSRIILTQYLKPFRLDREGNLADPFFNCYAYNHDNGTVNSTTKGYEAW